MVGFCIGCIAGGSVVFVLCLLWALRAMDPRGFSKDRGYRTSDRDYEDMSEDDASPGYGMS
jgi:hypothetical protein